MLGVAPYRYQAVDNLQIATPIDPLASISFIQYHSISENDFFVQATSGSRELYILDGETNLSK